MKRWNGSRNEAAAWMAQSVCWLPERLYSNVEDRLVTAEDVLALYGCWADEALMARLVVPVQQEETDGHGEKEPPNHHDHVHHDA